MLIENKNTNKLVILLKIKVWLIFIKIKNLIKIGNKYCYFFRICYNTKYGAKDEKYLHILQTEIS